MDKTENGKMASAIKVDGEGLVDINSTHPSELSKEELEIEMAELQEIITKCGHRHRELLVEWDRRRGEQAINEAVKEIDEVIKQVGKPREV